ncbi:HAD family phosphatase [Streptomyces triculaminicus]|uniref:HAD family phosphatase n=2 Tax=Streptomyces TaxID=1883 RepID=A0A939FV09_9ACTN|nr:MULTISPECIES: HAD family phosphatase [Streptomyces]MBO0657126.1 HAD family phosphatase [Streptomyces triculaminicus]QSY49486.1 HAD family phosphatase [Streptomyces griseocarneus]
MYSLPTNTEAVIFDCDGLLVNTEACWTVAEAAVFAEHGHPFGPEQKALVIGRTVEAAGDAMAQYLGRPGAGAELAVELLGRVRKELFQGAAALPGAAELVRACRAAVPIAVASNSPRELLDTALWSAGLADCFTHSFAADEVRSPKPAPELYLTACETLGVFPKRSVAFEDSATGIASARAAGLYVAVVPSLPGVDLDHDWLGTSLAEPELQDWARQLGHGTVC